MAETPTFKVMSVLGSGGFGTVYLARYLGEGSFSKEVALKVLNAEKGDVEDFARRLRDEARVLGLLRHRAIVGVDRLTRLEGRWTVVMEYVAGEDLSALVRHGPLPVGVALEIIAEVAGAIHAAFHSLGPDRQPLRLLHRDLKPSNVRVTPFGEVKVLDFGIARAEFAQREAKTRSFSFGTPEYMAPERRDGQEDAAPGDMYSLGAILAELLTGDRLGCAPVAVERFERRRGELLETLQAQMVPGDVITLVSELLCYEPEARPSAAEVARRAEALARRAVGPTLRDWAANSVVVSEHPPWSSQGDKEQGLRSGSLLSEGGGEPEVSRSQETGLATRPPPAPTVSAPTLAPTMAQRSPPQLVEDVPRPRSARARASVSRHLPVLIAALCVGALLLVALVLSGHLDEQPEAPQDPVSPVGVAEPPAVDLPRDGGSAVPPAPVVRCAPDLDGDGHGESALAVARVGPDCPQGETSALGDCDDRLVGVAPGLAERCDGRDNDCDGMSDEGYTDRNRNGRLDCAESNPAEGLLVKDSSRWLEGGLVLEARVVGICQPKVALQFSGGGRDQSAEMTIKDGTVRCGAPVAGVPSPEGAPSCGLDALTSVELGSDFVDVSWRCCFEGPKDAPGARQSCHTLGGGRISAPKL